MPTLVTDEQLANSKAFAWGTKWHIQQLVSSHDMCEVHLWRDESIRAWLYEIVPPFILPIRGIDR